jgi:Zn-dependent protease
MEILVVILALVISIIVHEAAHGYAANWLGDPTARLAGRLTLNPLPHIDLLGSIIIPAVLLASSSPFLFGWAKPVPYNPYNLKNQRWGEGIVAGAGPAVNLLIAFLFGTLIRFSGEFGLSGAFVDVAALIVLINLVLAIVNLIPIPPLDGSKVLRTLLPSPLSERVFGPLEQLTYRLGPFGLIGVLLILIFFLSPVIGQIVFALVGLFTGLSPYEISAILQNIF